jgi:hypothetical protein
MANIRIGKEVPRGFAASMTAVFAVVAKGSLPVKAQQHFGRHHVRAWKSLCFHLVSTDDRMLPAIRGIGIYSPKFSSRSDFWERLAA